MNRLQARISDPHRVQPSPHRIVRWIELVRDRRTARVSRFETPGLTPYHHSPAGTALFVAARLVWEPTDEPSPARAYWDAPSALNLRR
jgi:hypothetical protein